MCPTNEAEWIEEQGHSSEDGGEKRVTPTDGIGPSEAELHPEVQEFELVGPVPGPPRPLTSAQATVSEDLELGPPEPDPSPVLADPSGDPAALPDRSPPVDDTPRAGLAVDPDALLVLDSVVRDGFADVLEAMRKRSAEETFKREQVRRLQGEVDALRASESFGLSARAVVGGIFQLYDDVMKRVKKLRESSEEELPYAKLSAWYLDVVQDLELLLAHHGISRSDGQLGVEVDGTRQEAFRIQPTEDEALHACVARVLRPGFEHANGVVRKERVEVYRMEPRSEGGPQEPREAREALD